MIISLINRTSISDQEVQRVIRAINRQINEDFAPHWNIHATLKLEGALPGQINIDSVANLRGNAILYLIDDFDRDDPFGFHNLSNRGIPFGVVFTELARELGEEWSTTLSHEALELVADAEVNRLAMGPHPDDPNRQVYHWYEMCDAVQSETYDIDGVKVSNFVLPLYFTNNEEIGGRNDFLGTVQNGKTLKSFGINPGGYVGFYDPQLGKHDQRFGNNLAKKRSEIKGQFGFSRRGARYKDRSSYLTAMRAERKPEERKPKERKPVALS